MRPAAYGCWLCLLLFSAGLDSAGRGEAGSGVLGVQLRLRLARHRGIALSYAPGLGKGGGSTYSIVMQ